MGTRSRQKADAALMRQGLALARRAYGFTSPNPMVGAVLVRNGKVIGRGWHHRAGEPHAEVMALRDAEQRGNDPHAATLYVTLEPCSTTGRTPPCTSAILAAGIRRVVVGATDPNPKHAGRGLELLRKNGVEVISGVLADRCTRVNEAFNHWIVHRVPFVTVKAGMTLDGKIATERGESKWITGPAARTWAMTLRQAADAILVGVNTVIQDDPQLVVRSPQGGLNPGGKKLRRLVLDGRARTPTAARILNDEFRRLTTIVVGDCAPSRRVHALSKRVQVLVAPSRQPAGRDPQCIDLPWLLDRLGAEQVTSLLVEGGGEVNASFLLARLAHKVAFFYAPTILGGAKARRAVAGNGAKSWQEALALEKIQWKRLGPDWLLNGYLVR